jgi:hypothetical protein
MATNRSISEQAHAFWPQLNARHAQTSSHQQPRSRSRGPDQRVEVQAHTSAGAAPGGIPTLGTAENLLKQQLQVMQMQMHRQEIQTQTASDPDSIIKTLEPTLQDKARKWYNCFKGQVKEYVTQSELHHKYKLLQDQGHLIKSFESEAKKTWQWTKNLAFEPLF